MKRFIQELFGRNGSKMMMKRLTQKIHKGDFENARRLVADLSLKELEDVLMEIAFDTGDEAVYSFVCHLIALEESASLHAIASALMTHPFCFLPDGYARGLYHIRKALELDPMNVPFMEMMLFFQLVPDELVAIEEASEYARKIQSLEPNNRAALDFLNRK